MEVIMVVPEDGTANFDSFVSAGLQQPGLKIPGANTGEFAVAFKIVTGGEDVRPHQFFLQRADVVRQVFRRAAAGVAEFGVAVKGNF